MLPSLVNWPLISITSKFNWFHLKSTTVLYFLSCDKYLNSVNQEITKENNIILSDTGFIVQYIYTNTTSAKESQPPVLNNFSLFQIICQESLKTFNCAVAAPFHLTLFCLGFFMYVTIFLWGWIYPLSKIFKKYAMKLKFTP